MKLKFIIFAIILFSSKFSFSQCLDTLSIGNDTVLCAGQSIQLNASNGYFTYFWNTGNFGNSINVTQTGDYWLRTTILDTTNLVVNGNFSNGNTGFFTNYTYGTGGSWGLLSLEGQYAISTNPQLTHTNFVSCGDHTSGTGQMMVINGSATLNMSIWCQTVAVTPNTNYIFSAWFTSVTPSNPAVLNFNINGNQIGGAVSVSSTLCSWQNFYQTWNSGANTSATICMKNLNTAPSGNDFAIDDIYFAKICTFYDTVHVEVLAPLNVQLGGDTIICEGDTINLDAGNPGSTYLWSDNSTSQTLLASLPGVYNVQVTNGPCNAFDTLTITTAPWANPNLGNDTVFCEGTQITIDAGPGVFHGWNTGSFAQSIHPDTSGTYIVKVYTNTVADCPGYDTINIIKLPQPNLGPDTCIWKNSLPYVLYADNSRPNLNYLWSTSAITDSILINASGTYSVTISDKFISTNSGCSDSKNVFVGDPNTFITSQLLQTDLSVLENLGAGNQSICDYQKMRIIGQKPSTGTYNWTVDGNAVSTNSEFIFENYAIGNHIVMLDYSNGCVDEIELNLHSCILTIPNIITPNGDGVNDYFVIKNLTESFPNSTLQIFNRWGIMVYENTNYQNNWDGENSSDGVYFWVLFVADNKDSVMKGTVTILRNK